jgi:hypothetical protein
MDAMEPTSESAAPASPPVAGETRRSRSVLSGIALVLACLTIVLTTTAIWVHQVALNTDRFTALVTDVVADPDLIDPVAARISEQVVTGLDVEARIAAELPGPSSRLAGPITAAVQGAIERRLQDVLANPQVQTGLLRSLTFTHAHLVAFLRGDTSAITLEDGYVQLNVFPVLGAALTELQTMGIIPADVQLPDLSSDEAPAVVAERLEARLGITLPPGFGTIRLMQADRLAAAQTVVKAFDLLVVLLVILSVVLAVLAVWLARQRRRMLVYLTIGVIVALIVARVTIRAVANAAADAVAAQGLGPAVRAIVDATVTNLIGLTTIVLAVTAAICVVAYVAGRPAWLVRLAGRTSSAGRAAGTTAAGTVGAAATSAQAIEPGFSAEQIGVAVIVFAVVWIAVGLEIALLGAALIGAWLLIVRIVAGGRAGD